MPFLLQLLVSVALLVAGQIVTSIARKDQAAATTSVERVAGVRGTLQAGGDLSPRFVIGRYGTGGQLRYGGTWGNSGETPNAYFSRVVEVSCLPIRGFAGWFINGERVTLAGSPTGTLGYAVLEYRRDGVDYVWINPYLGDQTAEDPLMLEKFGSDPDRPYAGMVGRGCGYFVATALFNREIFTSLPEVLAEVDGIELDDPRGDDMHDNPIVAAYTLCKGLSYDGEWVYGPQGITDVHFRADNLEAEADKCDAARALAGGGSERRFRIGLDIALEEEPHAIVDELLKGCSGRWADLGGVFRFLVGAPGAPVVSFTDEDVVVSATQELDPFPGLESLYNAMTATYPEPDEAWEMKEAPPRYSDTLEAEDDGRRLPLGTAFRAVPHAVQVQELMRTAVEDARRFRRHVQTMPPEWWEYEPLDAAAWTSARNGYEAKAQLITMIEDLPNANQFVALQEIDAADYGWDDAFELPWDTAPLVIARPPPQIVVVWQPLPAQMADPDGNGWLPTIEITVPMSLVDVQGIRVQVRETWDDLRLVVDQELPYPPVEAVSYILQALFLPAAPYEVRIKYVPFSGRVTRWSNQDVDGTDGDWLDVTTPDVSPVPPRSIFYEQLGEDLQNTVGLVTGDRPGTIAAELAEIERRIADQASAAATDQMTNKEKTDLLKAIAGNALAAVITERVARVTGDSAIASALTQVLAVFGDSGSIANSFFKVEASAEEDGSEATIVAKVKASFGDTFSDPAWILRAVANGDGTTEGYFGIYGALYVFESIGGAPIPFFEVTADGVRMRGKQKSFALNDDDESINVIDWDTGFVSFGN